jgi:hypothetical protein
MLERRSRDFSCTTKPSGTSFTRWTLVGKPDFHKLTATDAIPFLGRSTQGKIIPCCRDTEGVLSGPSGRPFKPLNCQRTSNNLIGY